MIGNWKLKSLTAENAKTAENKDIIENSACSAVSAVNCAKRLSAENAKTAENKDIIENSACSAVSAVNNIRKSEIGSVFLITVFAIALLSVLVMGMLQMNTEEIQLMQNHIYATQALAIAEAGLNRALSEIREDDEWDDEIQDEPFAGGSYSVEVDGDLPNLTIESVGTSSQGFVARVAADITVDTSDSSDHTIRIDNLRINE